MILTKGAIKKDSREIYSNVRKGYKTKKQNKPIETTRGIGGPAIQFENLTSACWKIVNKKVIDPVYSV